MDCTECDRPQIWGGMSYVDHTDVYHGLVRRQLLKSVARSLTYAVEVREHQARADLDDCVLVQWRSGVYRRRIDEDWWQIPYEWWDGAFDDDGGQPFILRVMREYLTEQLEKEHGVVVNQATWFHKIHDGRKT